MQQTRPNDKVDVLLVGGGVMSVTLATLLSQLAPELQIVLVEKQDAVATESTDAWNNAGTGHAGYCELNYTPQAADGSISIPRALNINAAYEVSLQLWASLVGMGTLSSPKSFINATPHESFVWGEKDVAFLKQRHALLSQHHLFADMEYSEDPATIAQWMPLVMKQRPTDLPIAATRVAYGTDVDFGALTRQLAAALQKKPGFSLFCGHQVQTLKKTRRHSWMVSVMDSKTGKQRKLEAGFVFLGAGGGALPLLQKSAIPEGKGYGGFPVSGQWLVCKNPEIIRQHRAKVYGKAPLGAPPMSVPHLDTRYINGQPALLFGPYAGFTSKFLKQGSYFDLLKSVKAGNFRSLLGVARHNMDLTQYLIKEALQTHEARMDSLRKFYPQARSGDWELATAGKRVQIIKSCAEKGGKLEFGTEIVATSDGSLAALLGASPGASVSVQAMLDVLQRCFAGQMASTEWQGKLKALIPSYGESLVDDAALLQRVRQRTLSGLDLK
ncbi:MAG: malate dehydrogenase (quinone) [Betaproteobacteria bacterium HGW-Betaproteobacteria-8]|nr:MAG: malate dehydrogenase (quinone) [Betaproteobacteria bacterium HGW-Betaproteobacteria-8]